MTTFRPSYKSYRSAHCAIDGVKVSCVRDIDEAILSSPADEETTYQPYLFMGFLRKLNGDRKYPRVGSEICYPGKSNATWGWIYRAKSNELFDPAKVMVKPSEFNPNTINQFLVKVVLGCRYPFSTMPLSSIQVAFPIDLPVES